MTEKKSKHGMLDWRHTKATRVVVSTLGVLVGLAGMEHGYFEMLQGNAKPSSIFIEAIGPAQRFWEYGTERALTIVPNFLLTGILAMTVGLLAVIWASMYIDRKYGAPVLLLLLIVLWLVGGGFGPVFLSILAVVTATRINKPLTWWRTHLSDGMRSILAKLWPWSIVAFVLMFLVSVEIAIFGHPLIWFLDASTAYDILNAIGYTMVGLMLISILSVLAHDIQKQVHSQNHLKS
jgi:hypothetical protein